MLKLYDNGIYLVNGETICSCPEEVAQKTGRIVDAKEAEKGTMPTVSCRPTTRAVILTSCN